MPIEFSDKLKPFIYQQTNRKNLVCFSVRILLAFHSLNWLECILRLFEARLNTVDYVGSMFNMIYYFDDSIPLKSCYGGAARRATMMKRIRQENKHVLRLDAGDQNQGTP